MALSSAWFGRNSRLQQCLVSDPAHVQRGDRGPHVALIQQALVILDDLPIDQQELASEVYGRSTASAVKTYKTKRQIVNRSYQTSPDDIVGKMTIRQLDDDMGQQEKKRSRLLLAVGISNAQSPKGVVVTEPTNPWRKWADQFASADSAGRGVVVMPDGASPKVAATTITRAIGMTQAGVLLLSVGHGGSGAAGFSDEGMLDLAPGKAFRIGGRNSLLPGDPTNGKEGTRAHTHVFYDERIPNRALKGGFQESRKDHDEKSSSDTAKTRLANWRAYQDVCSAFKKAPIAGAFLLTCKVGGSSGFLKRVAQQWNTPIIAYTKKVAGQAQPSGKARLFLEGDAPGQDTNVPWGEVMFPVSRSMVLIRP